MLSGNLPKPRRIVFPERHKHRRHATISHFAASGRARRSVRLNEDQALRQEEDSSCLAPADSEPCGLGAGMEEGGTAAMLS
jgi:hypothetical protein